MGKESSERSAAPQSGPQPSENGQRAESMTIDSARQNAPQADIGSTARRIPAPQAVGDSHGDTA
jgi:hypothetical protein